jgi:hypothetical protein
MRFKGYPMAVLDDSDKLATESSLPEPSEEEAFEDDQRRRWPWGPFGSAVLILSLLIVFLLGSLFLSGPSVSSPPPSGLGTVLVRLQSCEPVSPGSPTCQERPLVGVEVDLHGAAGAYSGLTDTAGTFSFTVAPGDYTLAGQPQLGRANLSAPASQGIHVDSFGQVSLVLEYGH